MSRIERRHFLHRSVMHRTDRPLRIDDRSTRAASIMEAVESRMLLAAPAIDWSGYLGGANAEDLAAGTNSVAVDAKGNAYVLGRTRSAGWVSGGYDPALAESGLDAGDYDLFVVKLDKDGRHVWSTYLGGAGDETPGGIAVDVKGNIFVAGTTESDGWISRGYDTTRGGQDGFVVKLNTRGKHVWSTYLGGAGDESVRGLAVDPFGNAIVIGDTASNAWVESGFDTLYGGGTDGFVVKLTGRGAHFWSTYLGDTGAETASLLAVDSAGTICVAGTSSAGNWVSGGADLTNGGNDAYVVKLSGLGGHVWSTFAGGDEAETISSLALDASGKVLLAGTTASAGWTASGYDIEHGGGTDAFLVRYNSTGTVSWSTYIGGAGEDAGGAIAADADGNIVMVGQTRSEGWAAGGFDTTYAGSAEDPSADVFLIKFDAQGQHRWSSYLGGAADESPVSVLIDVLGNIVVLGGTASDGWVAGGFQTTIHGENAEEQGYPNDAFLLRVDELGQTPWSTYIGGDQGESPRAMGMGNFGGLFLVGDTTSPDWTSGGYDTSLGAEGVSDGFVMRVSGVAASPDTPRITGIAAAAAIITRPGTVSITVEVGGLSRRVLYYHDTNGNDALDAGDVLLGSSRPRRGESAWRYAARKLSLGEHRIFAVATDNAGQISEPVDLSLTITNDAPIVRKFVVKPGTLAGPGPVTFSMTGIHDIDGQVARFQLWEDANANGQVNEELDRLIQEFTGRSSAKWIEQAAGDQGQTLRCLVRAQDNDGDWGTAAEASVHFNSRPTIGAMVLNGLQPIRSIGLIDIHLWGCDDDGVIRQAEFYLDSDHNGLFDEGVDERVAIDTRMGNGISANFYADRFTVGEVTFFARLVDEMGFWSDAESLTVNIIE